MASRKKPPKSGKPASGRSGKKKAWPRHVRLLLLLLLLLLVLVLILAVLPPVRRWLGGRDRSVVPVSAPATPPVAAPVAPTEAYPPVVRHQPPPRQELQVELESFLWRAGIARDRVTALASPDVRGWQIRGSFPTSDLRQELRQTLTQLAPELSLVADEKNQELTVLWRGVPHFRLRFRPKPASRPSPQPVARLAIIMDDLGRDLGTAKALAKIDMPVTFAILPNVPAATEVAEFAHQQGREVLIHLPMEPENFPVSDPGTDALWLSSTEQEVRELLTGYFKRVPHAVGGNNHMGSRFTADRAAMGRVLGVMRERGLFFVDSVTSAESVAFAEAERLGMPAMRRDVFLDNEARVEPIRAQLRKLADLAAHRGSAVGICHPHPATLEALRREVQELKRRRIEVVPISRLLKG